MISIGIFIMHYLTCIQELIDGDCMQQSILIIATIFLVGLVVLNIWTIISLRSLKQSQKPYVNISDERYFDLKYRLQLLITTVVIVGVAITFLGWNIRSQIISETKSEVLSEVKNDIIKMTRDSIQTLTKDLSKLKSTATTVSEDQKDLMRGALQISSEYKLLTLQQKNLSEEVKQKLAGINTLLNVYITDAKIDTSALAKTSRIYFKNLKPINADLPKFAQPPIVNVISNSGTYIRINKTTAEFFDYSIAGNSPLWNDPIKRTNDLVTLWIVDRSHPKLLK